jgi:hypothetical protein
MDKVWPQGSNGEAKIRMINHLARRNTSVQVTRVPLYDLIRIHRQWSRAD